MPSLAISPLAPVLGQHVPLRGPARLLFSSYARTRCRPGTAVGSVTTDAGDRFSVDLSNGLEWHLWAFGSYEGHFAELFGLLVRPGDRCIDVGANVGVHTVRLARLAGDRGEVIAFEPDPALAERARSNVALNGLSNVRLVTAAATDQPGQLRLYRPDDRDTNRGRASIHPHPYLTGTAATVPAQTIDQSCTGPVALIKIDVEGHEAAVVRGACATIERDSPAVVFEYAPSLLDDADEQSPFGWLARRGYEFYRVRRARHALTGRGRLALERVPPVLPAVGGDFLALHQTRPGLPAAPASP